MAVMLVLTCWFCMFDVFANVTCCPIKAERVVVGL